MSSLATPSGLSTSSDNSALLRAAVAAGGFVLPPGTFPISSPLVIPATGCTIEGAGSYRSILKVTSINPGLVLADSSRLNISGIGITGNGQNGNAPGISITRKSAPNTFGVRLTDVIIQQFGGNGIDGPSANLIVSKFTGVVCENVGGIGINLTGVPNGSAGTSVVLEGCYANACKQAGYYLEKMNYSVLSCCACDASGAGYILNQCQGISLEACGAEGVMATGASTINDGTNFRINDCDGVDLGSGCWTYGNSHYVLHVSGNSMNIRAGRIGENSPLPSALGHTLVDSGCNYN
jgi:hypothetical protein